MLSEEEQNLLTETLTPLLDIDAAHRLAGLGTIHYIDPATVTLPEREDAIRQAFRDQGIETDRPLDLESALFWSAVAEHAIALEVDITFPGLSREAADKWSSASPDEGALALAKLIVVLSELDQARNEPLIREISDVLLVEYLAGSNPEDVASDLLFSGTIAIHALTGELIYGQEALAAEVNRRTGNCIGGFDEFDLCLLYTSDASDE